MIQNQFWDKFAKHYHIFSLFSKPNNWKYDIVIDEILHEKPQSILDLGCGSGILEKKLFDRGYRGNVVAMDSSKEMINIARMDNSNNCSFIIGNIEKLPTESVYDCVVAINSLFLVNDISFVLNSIDKIIDHEGLLIIVNPKPKGSSRAFIKYNFKSRSFISNLMHLLRGLKKISSIFRVGIMQRKLDKMHSNGIIQYVSLENMLDLLRSLGFIIVRSDNAIQAEQNYLIVAKKLK